MKNRNKHITILVCAAAMALTVFGFPAAAESSHAATEKVTATDSAGAAVEIDWNVRYHYADLEKQLAELVNAYPEYSTMESLGKSYEKRDLWCAVITDKSVSDKAKTEVAVMGNIHGGERESATCAMYSAWYLLENSDCRDVAELLDEYIIYVIPVINPDGYEESFNAWTRETMTAYDKDGDGIPFSDPLEDLNGDGFYGTVNALNMETGIPTGIMGRESHDANRDGILGNDICNSGVDMNRNFDYLWQKGDSTSKGPAAASEKETQIVREFIRSHPNLKALASLHTGEQAVLYPWCSQEANPKDRDEVLDMIFMDEASAGMAKAIKNTTQRNYYSMQSYYDFPTYGELGDYAYSIYGIHAYTIEAYCAGKYPGYSEYDADIDPRKTRQVMCMWNDNPPEPKTENYTHEEAVEMFTKNDVDYTKLLVSQWDISTGSFSYRPWGEEEGIMIMTQSDDQKTGWVPENQDIMACGVMDGIIAMMESEKGGIIPVSKCTLKKSSFICDGSVKTPTVMYDTVSMKEGTDCNISGNAKAAKPGRYKITVTGLDKFGGSVDLKYSIAVKKTGISSIKKVSDKAFKVNVRKLNNKYASDYQIRYSTSRSMKHVKKSLTGSKAVKKIGKLKKGKTYYVQVRTIKKIDDVKYYSKWSGKKSVRM